MRHGSLFSGIGGFDLAAQWMGWENVFQVEKDSFCQNVLAKNFPGTARYGDIKEFDGKKYRGAVDIISGGFPCQPFSSAGSRKGKKDNRFLWPEMLRSIREIRPTFIVGENVVGIIGLALQKVLNDLENEGYWNYIDRRGRKRIWPFVIPACGVNAPHRRDRVWIIAHSESVGDSRITRAISEAHGRSMRHYLSESDCSAPVFLSREMDWITDQTGAPVEPVFSGEDDGLSEELDADRQESVGNAIVPQVGYEIFKAIESVLSHDNKSTSPAVTLPSEVGKENTQVRNNQ